MPISQIAAENEATVTNLRFAFEDESNDFAKYAAFAAQANMEGLHGVASLFRAIAFADHMVLSILRTSTMQAGSSIRLPALTSWVLWILWVARCSSPALTRVPSICC